MPELAEVEFFRRQWNSGIGQKVVEVRLHSDKRIFRGNDLKALLRLLPGARLLSSEARGKQMLFQFSKQACVGIHLGMTGKLREEPSNFKPGAHDHFVLVQRQRALVFSDPRQFGRVLFHHGTSEPEWWTQFSPAISSSGFTFSRMWNFLQRRRRAPIKGVLLVQEGFPGIGNWMADEILWRAKIHPALPTAKLGTVQARHLWRQVRWVSRHALRIVSEDYSDPPASWLFRHRWAKGGRCPRDGTPLSRATIGGRTTAWCPKCQPLQR